MFQYSRAAPTPGRSRVDTHSAHNYMQAENILEVQRRMFRESKEKLEGELDRQRGKRIEVESKLVRLKDEISKKDLGISELEFRLNGILNDNEDLKIQNDRLRNEMTRHNQIYYGRIRDLELQINAKQSQLDELRKDFQEKFEEFRTQGQTYVEHLTFQMQKKEKTMQQKVKNMEADRRDRQFQIKQLNESLLTQKMEYEDKLLELQERNKEEESKKLNQKNKQYEGRMKQLQETKDNLNRKCSELQKQLSAKNMEIQDLNTQIRSSNQRINLELSSDTTKISQLTLDNLKKQLHQCKLQLMDKDAFNTKSRQQDFDKIRLERDSAIKQLKQNRISSQQSIEDLKHTVVDLKQRLQNQRREKVKAVELYKILCGSIQSGVHDIISKAQRG